MSRSRRRLGSYRVMPGFCRSRYDAKNLKSAMKTVHYRRPTLIHLGCMIEMYIYIYIYIYLYI